MAEEKSHDEIKNITSKVEKLKQHLIKNKHDYKTKRALQIEEAKLRKLKKYKRGKNGKSNTAGS